MKALASHLKRHYRPMFSIFKLLFFFVLIHCTKTNMWYYYWTDLNMYKKFCEGGNHGNFDCTVKYGKSPLYVLIPKTGNEEVLQSDTLTVDTHTVDCNINPARHTDGYARSTTKVPRQIHRNRPGQRSRCCSTEATILFQSDTLPAAGWNEPD